MRRELFVCYRYRMKLLRDANGKIPVFTSDALARTYLAGMFRPTADDSPRAIRTVSWPGKWKVRKHDYFVEKRAVLLTKNHVVDPEPPNPPMEAEP